MSRITVHVPDEAPRDIDVGPAGVVLGRAEDADVFIAEPRASRRHLRLVPADDGSWIAEDLGSSNGTWVGDQRIARRRLRDGDALRVGATRIDLGQPADALVASSLLSVRTMDSDAPAAGVAAAAPQERPRRERPAPRAAVQDPRDLSGLVKGGVLLLLAAIAWFGADRWFGERARRQTDRAAARQAALDVLSVRGDSAAFGTKLDAFRARYPDAAELGLLDRHGAAARAEAERAEANERRLGNALGRLGQGSLADVRLDLLRLRTEAASDRILADRVAEALRLADQRQEEDEAERLRTASASVQAAMAAGRFAAAEALVASLEARGAARSETAIARTRRLRESLDEAARARYEQLRLELARGASSGRLERLVAAALDLEGTSLGRLAAEQVRSLLRSGPADSAPTGAPTPAGSTPRPEAPRETGPLPREVLTRLGTAREDLQQRRWATARTAFAALADGSAGPDLARDAQQQVADLDRLLTLVEALAARAAAEPVPVRLSSGRVVVTGADGDQVTWRVGDLEAQPHPWGTLAAPDVLTLLTPPRPATSARQALAILAVGLDQRAAAIEALAPIYEGEGPERAATDLLVARHLYGRADVPEGGYRLHGGDLLDAAGYQRVLDAERVVALRTEIDDLLADLAKEPAYRKLEKVREVRAQLDEARRYALLAIFNETHYPYPYNRGSKAYQAVQAEVDRRVAVVAGLWNNPAKARIARTGPLAKRLDRLEAALIELKQRQGPDPERAAAAWAFLAYANDTNWTVQNWFVDEAERERLAYSDWVRSTYNAARTAEAQAPEREQVAITNDYRNMMGFSATVQPGPGAYDDITDATAKAVLDAGTITRIVPLRAVRVDDRLVRAARDHSLDMMRRGYFSHFAPPNPETGKGTTAPHDRMGEKGYRGWAMSENIAMNDSALGAHKAWCTSSGHHRNILSPWEDLGVGAASRRWTQNFGSGGGGPTVIQPTTDAVTDGHRAPPTTGR